jgi:hypothetical protein
MDADCNFFEELKGFKVPIVKVPCTVHSPHPAAGVKTAFNAVGQGRDFARKEAATAHCVLGGWNAYSRIRHQAISSGGIFDLR